MNETREMILLTWYKGAENSPWVLTLEDSNRVKHEVTVGENGYAAAGPRLTKDLEYMNNNIYRYPMRYDMRQVQNKIARLVDINVLKDKITYIETPVDFEKELKKSYRQTPFSPLTEEVEYVEEGTYFESAITENKIMAFSAVRLRQITSSHEIIDNNNPKFNSDELTVTTPYEEYSPLDNWGRVGVANALLSKEMMTDEERGDISEVFPTGWTQTTYSNIEDNWLYHRSHLIGYQFTGQNANERNLMTGTAHFNTKGMYPIERQIAAYIKETGNHVRYRVTPHFEGENLLASGVYIEAYSIEDLGKGIRFHVYIPNEQPGIEIDYMTGISSSDIDTEIKLLDEYAPNSHVFWLFASPENIEVVDSTTLDIYIDAYNWPEGYQVPESIGKQNILDSQRTVRIELLGANSFSLRSNLNMKAAKRYKIYIRTKDKELQYVPQVLTSVEAEAQQYLKEIIKDQGFIAFSLQYSTEKGLPVENNGNLLSVMYGTDFTGLSDVSSSITNGNFQGININKSLLKEAYSLNAEVQKKYYNALNLPLVEYVNQSDGKPDHGINISEWVGQTGAKLPPDELENEEYDNFAVENLDQEEVIDRIVEDAVKDDIEKNRSREDHYIHGYINNDLSFIPPNDDRVESGEIYNETYEFGPINEDDEDAGALPYDYTHKVRIGDVLLEIPPLSIRATKQQANESVSTLRSKNAMHKGVGNSRHVLNLDLYFHDLENINGRKVYAYTKDNGEQVFYYMDGLRTLLAQFNKSPFVPIDNDYINDVLGVHNVAMRSIQSQTVEGFPEALMVTLVLEEFDTTPYLLGETNLGMVMNYPLYRWYYQKALQKPTSSFSTSTYLPPVENLDNRFTFQIANEAYLNNRTDIIREFNALKTPSDYKRQLEDKLEQDAEAGGVKESEIRDKRSVMSALDSYSTFQSYYNGLPSSVRTKYKPYELPIFTTPGQKKNLKGGSLVEIENSDEYQQGVESGKKVYGQAFQGEEITNLIYNSADGDYSRTKRTKVSFWSGDSPVGVENSIFIGSYQLSDYGYINNLIKEHNLPGIFQIQIQDTSLQNELNDLLDKTRELGKESGYTEMGGGGGNPYSSTYFDKDTFFIPAGKIGDIDFLSKLEEISGQVRDVINEQVEDYTSEYNQMVNIINAPESEIPRDDYIIDDLIPLSLSVSISNNLSMVQTQSAETPTFQYLGSQQPEVQLTFSTSNEGAKQVDELFRTIARYAKQYRTGLVSNFLQINNSLVNLFGVGAVLPQSLEINTVEEQPDEKLITMVLSGFDKTQRKQEALYSFAGGKVSKNMKDLHLDGYDPQVNSLYIHEKMRHMELYPDLELPFYSELEADLKHLNSGVKTLENRTGQVYLDPDFYISTETTVRKKLSEILGDSRGTQVSFRDDTGNTAYSNAAFNQALTFGTTEQDEINSAIDEDYANPYLEWKGYENEDAEAEGNEELYSKEFGLNITPQEGKPLETSLDAKEATIKAMGTGENPDDQEVWEHLYNELLRIYWNEPELVRDVLEQETEDFNLVKDSLWAIFGFGIPMDVITRVAGDYLIDSRSIDGTKESEGISTLKEGEDHTSLQQIARSPLEVFFTGYKNHATKASFLNNGLLDAAAEANKADGIIDYFSTSKSEGIINPDDLYYKFKNNKGNKKHVQKLYFHKLFVYMKSIMDTESNWQQFDKNGKPFTTSGGANGNVRKVGIMGAPVAKAANQQELERLATDWKYNITFSLLKMKQVYNSAKQNDYADFHFRPLDWAVASHSGSQMPMALNYPHKQNDRPHNNLPIAPESFSYFNNFAKYYGNMTRSAMNGNPLVIFTTPDGVLRDTMAETLGLSEEEADELIEEAFELESNNFDQYTLEDKIKHMYVDMQQYDQVGRMVRAFPSFSLMLIDEGKWFQNFRTWDNFYGYNSLHSIDVYKSRKIAADTAVITMSNMYGNLSSSHGSQSSPDLRLPSFFSSQFWKHYVFGLPTDRELDSRAERYEQVMLQTGARVHLRMGYGADASFLPVVFNGSISEMNTDEVIEITAQSDALELQNVISGDVDDSNEKGWAFTKRVQEPRKTIGELMTAKGNWLKEVINLATDATFFKESPMGIAHFGSTVHSEEGNRAILPGAHNEEFGESLQNVYSQNGMETKSQWRNTDGSEMQFGEKAKQWAIGLAGNLAVLIGATPPFDEDNIAVSYYGRTVWEIIQTFALASQDYVAEVVPFEFRSTLFFGKPHWMMQYRYDSDFIYDSDRETIDRTIKNVHQKTFMQAHIYNSNHSLISNNIMASEHGVYNNVIVTYDGRQAGPVQADSDIRFDKQRTIDIEANILAPRMFEYFRSEDQALIYGQSTLRDFMKDMYKGEYSVIGDPSVKPYDVVFLNDNINDMHGIHLVKAVHHSMDGEHGLVSYIEPDAYVYNFDEELGDISAGVFNIGKNLNMKSVGESLAGGAVSMVGGAVLLKLVSKLAGKPVGWITGVGSKAVNSRVAIGATKRVIAKFYETVGGFYSKNSIAASTGKALRGSTSMSSVKALTQQAHNGLMTDMSIHGAKAAAETTGFFSKASQGMVNFSSNPTTMKAAGGIVNGVTKTGKVIKGVVTSKAFLFVAATVTFEIATSTIGEWWSRKKQNAEAVKVVPLIYQGRRWTALMNWHKGSVLGDDPSLRDKLMNAEFFDKDIDPEVNEVFGKSLFKFLNLFTDE